MYKCSSDQWLQIVCRDNFNMKGIFAIGIFVVLAVGSHGFTLQSEADRFLPPQEVVEPSSHETKTYLTRVDHFRPQNTRAVRFSYTQKLDHYRSGGPIYFYINDGGLFTTVWLDTGLMHDIAMQEGAALITSGHRYFRENIPTDSASFENLEFLTLEQSMADIATLVSVLRMEFPTSSRVILWGSGYGATLAVMARQKYPHLIDAVWSSSGIFEPDVYITDTFMHMESVIRNIGGETCANQVRSAFDEMENMIFAGQGVELGELMNHCGPVNVTSDLSVAAFYQGQIEFFNFYMNIHHYHGLLQLCQDINATDLTPLVAFSRWVEQAFTGVDCFDFGYYYRTALASNIEWNQPGTDLGIRQWYYYKCTQLGLWEVTSPFNDLFPHRVRDTFHYYMCIDILGANYDSALLYDATDALRILYGGLNPGVSNVVYTNGEMDMWFSRGMTNVVDNPDVEVINIPFYAKSADLRSLSDFDGVNLRDAKLRIQELVSQWSRPTL